MGTPMIAEAVHDLASPGFIGGMDPERAEICVPVGGPYGEFERQTAIMQPRVIFLS